MEPFSNRKRLQVVTTANVPARLPDIMTSQRELKRAEPLHDGFLSLYDTQYDRMVRVAYFTTGSAAVAEDVVQDAFLDVFRHWERIQSPSAYVYRAVLSRSTSWLRRTITERRRNSSDGDEKAVWHDDDAGALADMIRALTPRQRAAVLLRYVEGFSESDIAIALHCRPGTVKSLLNRSRSALKAALTQ